MNRRAMIKPNLAAAAVALAILLSGCGHSGAPAQERPPLEGAKLGGPFTLTSESGKRVSWSDFDGRYRIVYFGYTFCPDACPTDVAVLMQGLNAYAKGHPALAAQIQPLFITIDPARDTPAKLAEFTDAFSPRLLGLTGSPSEIDAAAKEFAVYHAKGATTPGGGYLMDHSRMAYLMGRHGEPIALLSVDKGPVAVAADLAKWVH